MKKVTVQILKPEKKDWEPINDKFNNGYYWNGYELRETAVGFIAISPEGLLTFDLLKTLEQAQEACWQHYLKDHNMEEVDG